MRAVTPDRAGQVVRDGVRLGFEMFGQGEPTILLLPTWTIVHSRFWKMQVPYLSRHYRVITYDGPGNGRSDRVTDPARYSAESYAADAAAVLDACEVERAVVVGLSLGAQYATRLAALFPARVMGLALIGPAMALGEPLPERAGIVDDFHRPYPQDPQGWDKYNLAYWHDHYQDFAQFFFEQVFTEAHSTKPIEDAVGWALEGGPDILEAEAARPRPEVPDSEIFTKIDRPVLVLHGTEDRIQPHRVGEEAAQLSQGSLVSIAGSGHIPNVRDPVRVNLLLRDFVERLVR
jgi:pimeloyl-ACP methyl ester carboxylesterase